MSRSGRPHRPEVYLAAAVRTPIGRFGGALAGRTAAELGATAARACLKRSRIPPESIDECIFGNARQAGGGPNVARQIAHAAGVPEAVPAYTINKACGSGLRTITAACQAIAAGDVEVALCGGTESMSRLPFLLEGLRDGYPLGHRPLVDAMYRDGFLCPLCGQLMGETAENLADRYAIGRPEQDAYAVETQHRCERARAEGRFAAEMTPVAVPERGGERQVTDDEHPRAGVTLEAMARLRPVFRQDGTVHAGNSSGITDGAAAVLVASGEAVRRLGLDVMARVVDYVSVGVEPAFMGIGPVPAVRKLLERQGLGLDDIDLIELNEAFAVQVLACQRELGVDPQRLNVNGGAIALGHPIGCTGTRIVVSLLHEMARRGARRGLATLCISGGQGMGLLVELC